MSERAAAADDLVPDPGHDGPPMWDMYGLGAAGIAGLLVGWVASAHTHGAARVACRVVAVAVGLYGTYLIVISVGLGLFSHLLGRWSDGWRGQRARDAEEALLELRFGRGADEAPAFDLTAALETELGDAASCGESLTAGGAVTYYLHGQDLDHLVASARAVAARFSLPPNAYLWVPSQERPGYGAVLSTATES